MSGLLSEKDVWV